MVRRGGLPRAPRAVRDMSVLLLDHDVVKVGPELLLELSPGAVGEGLELAHRASQLRGIHRQSLRAEDDHGDDGQDDDFPPIDVEHVLTSSFARSGGSAASWTPAGSR